MTQPQSRPPRPVPCKGQGCGLQVVFLPSQASEGKRSICATLPGVKMFVMVRSGPPLVLADGTEIDAGLVLADQDCIDAGQAQARQVTVYGSHHATYKPIPACTQAAAFRREGRPARSPTTATRSPR